MAWIAFSLSFVFASLSYLWPTLSDPLGRGWNLFGTANVAWQPYLMSIVPFLQAGVLIGGLLVGVHHGASHRFGKTSGTPHHAAGAAGDGLLLRHHHRFDGIVDRMKAERFALLFVIVLVIGLPLAAVLARSNSDAIEIHGTIADNGGWTPSDLTAQVGQPLHLRLTSDDVVHGFAVGQSSLAGGRCAARQVDDDHVDVRSTGQVHVLLHALVRA